MNPRLMLSPTRHVTRPRCSAEPETGTRCKNLVAWGNWKPLAAGPIWSESSGEPEWVGYCGKHPAPAGSAMSTAWAYLPADAQDAIRGAG